MKNYLNNINAENAIVSILRKISIHFDISSYSNNAREYNSGYYSPSNILNKIETSPLGNITSSEREIINILIDKFEDKYKTPFLLYALEYKYEEIASILQLSTGIVKSRIFYIRKTMQRLLTDRSNASV